MYRGKTLLSVSLVLRIFRIDSTVSRDQLLDGRGIPPTQLSSAQASNMINIAAKVPAERRAAIDKIRQQPEFGANSKAAAWGLEIEPTMMPVNGRALPPPRVQYHPSSGRGATPSVQFGSVSFLSSSFSLFLSLYTSSYLCPPLFSNLY